MPLVPSARTRRALLWASAALGAGAPLSAAEPALRAVLFEVPPYAGKGQAGGLEGLHVDRARALGQRLGREVQITLLPFARVPLALRQGQADFSLGFATPALQSSALSLGAVAHDELIVIAAHNRPLARASDLRGRLVGRARGGCQDLGKGAHPPDRWFEVDSFDNGLRMLQLGRLDALCLTRAALEHAARQAGFTGSEWGDEWVVHRRAIELWIRRDLPAPLQERLKAAAQSLATPAQPRR